ncbi:response regulator transcription factor [Paenibacillus hunanensis]|uniref:NarL family two-component system response regulator YdfI n=1 Tax=Paenibacillus hunanensis TaxID=539262 RepID=A0ABU1IYZ4_9BACL|nr:response regulator transcription factor [Paenibacillus hunanensis]MCL9659150.1 response regulator transcription factor [Paenibacillus hunanensis]MDR6244481.1 NarL family two-component system response regulator YdfI [Paenibacillus hunanensis]WPP40193.1 response regulator transcription factor [Paenibacillus hunanensis]GGI99720.1 DNA-binding response regulator [Paenibacillus hunanensis]
MDSVWKVIMIDNHPALMLGTKIILEETESLSVVGTASSVKDGVKLAARTSPHLILLDDSLPEGNAEFYLRQIKRSSPDSHVIVLTGDNNLSLFAGLMSMGASGVLSKESSPAQLLHLISGLRQGLTVIPLSWLSQGVVPVPAQIPTDGYFELSQIEHTIMTQITQGFTYDKIAETIRVSRRSVDNYLRKIYDKLGVSSRAQAIEKYTLYSHTASFKGALESLPNVIAVESSVGIEPIRTLKTKGASKKVALDSSSGV